VPPANGPAAPCSRPGQPGTAAVVPDCGCGGDDPGAAAAEAGGVAGAGCLAAAAAGVGGVAGWGNGATGDEG
jgi:hypothetical protein